MDKHVVVVGGGITGLAAAYELSKQSQSQRDAGWTFQLVEASSRLGGEIWTEKAGDFVLELGVDSFVTAKDSALKLCRELGLSHKLCPTLPGSGTAYVYRNGKLRALPAGMCLGVPLKIVPFMVSDLVSWPGKLRMGLEFFLRGRKDGRDESISEFTNRRFGREALHSIVGPLIGSICAGDPDRMSLKSTLPQFFDLERRYGSLIRGLMKKAERGKRPLFEDGGPMPAVTPFMSLEGGMEELVLALSGRIASRCLVLGKKVLNLTKEGQEYRLELEDRTVLLAQGVLLTCPAYESARLIRSLDPSLAGELEGIPYVSTATLNLTYRLSELPVLPAGSGWVMPRSEGRFILAATFCSQKFPGRSPSDHALLRCFVGGTGMEERVFLKDGEVLGNVRKDLNEILGIRSAPEMVRIHRWPKGIPQYLVGHERRLVRIRESLSAHPGLHLAGAGYDGIGLPDCIQSGVESARAFIP